MHPSTTDLFDTNPCCPDSHLLSNDEHFARHISEGTVSRITFRVHPKADHKREIIEKHLPESERCEIRSLVNDNAGIELLTGEPLPKARVDAARARHNELWRRAVLLSRMRQLSTRPVQRLMHPMQTVRRAPRRRAAVTAASAATSSSSDDGGDPPGRASRRKLHRLSAPHHRRSAAVSSLCGGADVR